MGLHRSRFAGSGRKINRDKARFPDLSAKPHQWHVDCIDLIASQRRLRSAGLLKPPLAATQGTGSGYLTEETWRSRRDANSKMARASLLPIGLDQKTGWQMTRQSEAPKQTHSR
jgi:hypothetical protein